MLHEFKLLIATFGLVFLVLFFLFGWAHQWDKRNGREISWAAFLLSFLVTMVIWGYFL